MSAPERIWVRPGLAAVEEGDPWVWAAGLWQSRPFPREPQLPFVPEAEIEKLRAERDEARGEAAKYAAECNQAVKTWAGETARADALAARVERLEGALRRIRDEGGDVEGFAIQAGVRDRIGRRIASMIDSSRYVDERDMLRIIGIARAVLSTQDG